MKENLVNLLNNSYAPYSNFRVSAIAVMNDGREFVGVNVENAAYGSGICAERSAILNAISNGYKRYDFDRLYVMCDTDKLGTPCFICRQVISELFESDKEIICVTNKGEERVFTVSELCPYPFSDKSLN